MSAARKVTRGDVLWLAESPERRHLSHVGSAVGIWLTSRRTTTQLAQYNGYASEHQKPSQPERPRCRDALPSRQTDSHKHAGQPARVNPPAAEFSILG